MEIAHPAIAEALRQFLTEESERLSPRTLATYREVVAHLTESLEGEGHLSLDPDETTFWEPRWRQDREANSFCNTFGPDKIADHVHRFLGDFPVGPERAPIAAAARVVKTLAAWLEEHGYWKPGEADGAVAAATAAARAQRRAAPPAREPPTSLEIQPAHGPGP